MRVEVLHTPPNAHISTSACRPVCLRYRTFEGHASHAPRERVQLVHHELIRFFTPKFTE